MLNQPIKRPSLITTAFILMSLTVFVGNAAEPLESPYGICAHIVHGEFMNHEIEMETAADCGCRYIRTDFNILSIHQTPDIWNFRQTDIVVKRAKENNIQIVPVLSSFSPIVTPAWMLLDKWEEFVRTVVQRYHQDIQTWEIWTEPNNNFFWENADPEHYLTLLKSSYQTIKSINPKLNVMIGGFIGVPEEFIETIYTSGGKEYFDIMNFHIGNRDPVPEKTIEADMVALKTIMKKHGDGNKPIWITEIGYSVQPGKAENSSKLAEQEQSKRLTRSYIVALCSGAEKVFWYELQDANNDASSPLGQSGLMDIENKLKPSFFAYKTVVQQIPPGSIFTEKQWHSEDNSLYYPQWTRPDGSLTGALWSLKPGRVQIEYSGEKLSFLMHEGQKVDLEKSGKYYEIQLSDAPVYFNGAHIRSIKRLGD